ncbi:DNA cytosine methyltransferase [Rhodobaculum claviforme]|uniref:DNA (cytosine-5-)-methyltransferase n=1 Tax=Rhodobaculum claviforme TaxID=1549854 RepID=A0A934TJM2_9RHOB|nr:DNA cytosine methyltransferase [Rhodobaculum claviforme]MBK5927022.1 DNA (cytosine-5-)-methyltransferase [Rhodobaculum claviforme]
MISTFGIVDLFAGPGGLGEGFASLAVGGHAPFRIGISVEKEASAHRTLTLRAFLRAHQARHGALPQAFIDFHAGLIPEPAWSAVDAAAWEHATAEAQCLELGAEPAAAAIDRAIGKLRRDVDDTILIGGPPCQAYSLVGRARAKGKVGYVPEEDERHYLFREYIRVLDRLRPAAFVMENVKGMLSSTIESRLVFEMLMEDLASLGTGRGHHYEMRAIRVADGRASLQEAAQPSDFIVRSEEFGVPQRRHRVIIVGIRSDLADRATGASIPVSGVTRNVDDAIGMMTELRSGLSRGCDDPSLWRREVVGAARLLARIHRGKEDGPLRDVFSAVATGLKNGLLAPRLSARLPENYGTSNDELLAWLDRPALRGIAQHETRGHMPSDLGRYLFAAVFGEVRGYSPKAADFPLSLSPDHRNWYSGVFNDRFRVQLAGKASTTITSHISKDGHYFIHPDPMQCRSLTVREAARLQTFPDDYYFLGNRTQQYVQVGNAVPPYLARQIAQLLLRGLSGRSSGEPASAGASDMAARSREMSSAMTSASESLPRR